MNHGNLGVFQNLEKPGVGQPTPCQSAVCKKRRLKNTKKTKARLIGNKAKAVGRLTDTITMMTITLKVIIDARLFKSYSRSLFAAQSLL